MTLHLRVATSLDPLVDALVDVLSRPLADPFTPEVVAVPGDGVKAWLVDRLARRVGGDGAGIVANVDFVYPAEIVRRAVGGQDAVDAWSVGPLTWAVHAVLRDDGADLGLAPDLARARAIADLFDRYTLHRPVMVTAWGAGRDVDAADQQLAPSQLWQPRLWRLVRERLGGTSEAERMAHAARDLVVDRVTPALPSRVALFGLASIPGPHLRVLTALSHSIDVHVLAPVASAALWTHLRTVADQPLHLPLDRRSDPSAHLGSHPLVASWGRASREAHLLLLDATRNAPSEVIGPDHASLDDAVEDPPLLALVQRGLVRDTAPGLQRPALRPDDRSIEWHRCHGPARQVEVLRDVVLHLLQETGPDGSPVYEPRDIAVLCPDVPTFAPFAQAAFAGDPEHGVPVVPLRIADRSLRADNPLLDAVAALLQLLDGRLAASELLAFASLPPVRARFSLDTERLERIGAWAQATNVRWGLDSIHRSEYGLPDDLVAHTWQAGVDQLLLGATMADTGPRLGLGGAVPYGDIEGSDVETAGLLAHLVHEVGAALSRLGDTASPGAWCDDLATAARTLLAVADDDAYAWRDLDDVLTELRCDAEVVGAADTELPGRETAALLLQRLGDRAGRPRFGTGSVTISSLTAQRGVPHRVICLLGLDGDLGSGGVPAADDLSAAPACVGDRDPRSELRAQLLDAVLAAGDRLVLVTTGRDVRTNAEVAPAVPVAELMDLVDATVTTDHPSGRASRVLAVDHPRQAWSIRAVTPDALRPGPWSFDRGILRAATIDRRRSLLAPTAVARPDDLTRIALRDLLAVVRNPVQCLLQGRLGVWLEKEAEPVEDLIPVAVSGLDLWRVCEDLLEARLDAEAAWNAARRDDWIDVQRALGSIPPLDLGRDSLRTADERVDALVHLRDEVRGTTTLALTETVGIEIPITVDGAERTIVGEIAGVCDGTTISVSSSRLKPVATLQCWVRASALAVQTGRPARAAVIGRHPSSNKTAPPAQAVIVDVASAADGRRALALLVDALLRARRTILPVLPSTACSLLDKGHDAAREAWDGGFFDGDAGDAWVSFALPGLSYDDLVAMPAHGDEVGELWTDHASRLERWAHRLWGGLDATSSVSVLPEDGAR